MKLKSKKLSKMSILFYIIAAIMMIGFALTVYNVTIYIMGLFMAEQVTFAANWADIILYYVNNTFVFLGMSVIIFGIGYGIQLLKDMTVQETAEEVIEDNEKDVNDILEEIKVEESL